MRSRRPGGRPRRRPNGENSGWVRRDRILGHQPALESRAGRAFADSLLAPLVEHDRAGRGDLVASLRAWLAHHGQWDPAAAALGVHRHTLRRRMGLVGQLLGRDLDSPTVRSELWLALEVAATRG